MSTPIDHIIFGTPNLQEGIEYLEALLGVSSVAGGSHPSLGTRNAIIALGPLCYLEIMGPDLEQTDFQGSRPFGIDTLESGQLVGWVARREGLSQFVKSAKYKGVELGDVIAVSRETPEGDLLKWNMTYLTGISPEAASVLPLFIDWGKTPHPSLNCAEGAQLTALEIEYPAPSEMMPLVDALELGVSVQENSQPGLRALIDCPRGKVELRSA
ncbi:MAG: VOC family protein [Pseudomonadales bacterium]